MLTLAWLSDIEQLITKRENAALKFRYEAEKD